MTFPRFPVLPFPPLQFGPLFSSPAFSTPAIWFRVFSIPTVAPTCKAHYFSINFCCRTPAGQHCPSRRPTNRVKTLKANKTKKISIKTQRLNPQLPRFINCFQKLSVALRRCWSGKRPFSRVLWRYFKLYNK